MECFFSGGGSEQCDVIFEGGLTFCDECDEGEGVKNRPKSRDVIYGRPLCIILYCILQSMQCNL